MAQHQVVKPEKIAAVAAVALEEQLVVPAVMHLEPLDQYIGADDDTINVVVEGVLPYRSYGWRADRSQEVVFDEYAERKIPVTFGGDTYSAVKLTDEQNLMDLKGWSKLATKQTEAIGRGLEYKATQAVINAPYEVQLGVSTTFDNAAGTSSLKAGLIRAGEVLKRLRVPGPRVMLVGSNWASALLNDPLLNLASNVGDDEAQTALQEATLGRRFGFTFVEALELDPDTAIAMVPSAFIFTTGAPTVPQSVPFGASASTNGVAVRWIRDYDSTRFQDRSIFNLYDGYRHVDDVLVGTDSVGQSFVSRYVHFVRAIKLVLNGSDVLPDPDGDDEKATELGNITGIWATADNAASSDAATIPASTILKADGTADTPTSPKAAKGEILVVAGIPGTVTAGSGTASALASLTALNTAVSSTTDGIKVNVSPTGAWTTGQYVTLADGTTQVNWTGTTFAAGAHA